MEGFIWWQLFFSSKFLFCCYLSWFSYYIRFDCQACALLTVERQRWSAVTRCQAEQGSVLDRLCFDRHVNLFDFSYSQVGSVINTFCFFSSSFSSRCWQHFYRSAAVIGTAWIPSNGKIVSHDQQACVSTFHCKLFYMATLGPLTCILLPRFKILTNLIQFNSIKINFIQLNQFNLIEYI